MDNLGKLKRVQLRDIWKTEAQDFTPWLARDENLLLLGETLKIELELEAIERNVGVFRADILCKDTLKDRWVLIENQLERTDHSHLGQLLTYAAGLDAVTIIWIAERVSDEHRAAIDWLNDITDQDVRFFALEIELWRIGESNVAPKFNVVSKPNDWTRSTTSAKKVIDESNMSPTRQKQREYWTAVQEIVANTNGAINPVRPLAQSWLAHGIGKTGALLSMSMNTRNKWIRTEIYLTGKNSKWFFRQLKEKKAEIEGQFCAELDWQELPEGQDARICLQLDGTDPLDISDWSRQHEWLVRNATKLQEVFRPYIVKLDSSSNGSSTHD